MRRGVNCLLKLLGYEVFIKWVILFQGLLPHLNLLVMLRSSWRGISLVFHLLFCLVVCLQIQGLLFAQHLLSAHIMLSFLVTRFQ